MPRKTPRPITAPYLERVVVHYLERYFTSRAHLRRLLAQRVRRSAEHHGTEVEEGMALVDALLERLEQQGILNDALYASSVARSMRRKGASEQAIRAKLGSKGLRGALVDVALAEAAEENAKGRDPDLVAAARWARKKRIGPWTRELEQREALRQKQLARLGRRGFSWGTAKQVIDGELEELEELL